MHLYGNDALQGAACFVEVDDIHGLHTVDPVPVVVSFDENSVVVPLLGGKALNG